MKYLLVLLSLISACAFGQGSYYYPDGKPIPKTIKFKNINELNKHFDPHGRVYVDVMPSEKITSIGYKLFTNNALWVLCEDTTGIRDAIANFDLEKFLSGYQAEMAIEKHIKTKTLTDIFILETLGPPSWRDKVADANLSKEAWGYDKLKLNLHFSGGIVTSYRRYD